MLFTHYLGVQPQTFLPDSQAGAARLHSPGGLGMREERGIFLCRDEVPNVCCTSKVRSCNMQLLRA